jgi:hypothetical protein
MNSAFHRSTDSYLTEGTETHTEGDACSTLRAYVPADCTYIQFNIKPSLIIQSIGINS